jgi:hypothetical protein
MNIRTQAIVTMGLALCSTTHAWDFDYTVEDVYQPQADTYVVAATNIQKYNEGNGNTFYRTAANNIQASLTYQFNWCVPTTNVLVQGYFHIINFGSQYGNGSLWASTNGADWSILLDVPTPPSGAVGPVYSNTLPSSLTGSTSLWIQARLYSVGWQSAAQWLRDYNNGHPTPTFRVAADLMLPLVTPIKAIVPHFDNLFSNQQYTIEVSHDMSQWTPWDSFTATNVSVTHDRHYMIGTDTNLITVLRAHPCGPATEELHW